MSIGKAVDAGAGNLENEHMIRSAGVGADGNRGALIDGEQF